MRNLWSKCLLVVGAQRGPQICLIKKVLQLKMKIVYVLLAETALEAVLVNMHKL